MEPPLKRARSEAVEFQSNSSELQIDKKLSEDFGKLRTEFEEKSRKLREKEVEVEKSNQLFGIFD